MPEHDHRFIEWLDQPDALRAAVEFTSARTGFVGALIEKDFWCSLVLARLFAAGGCPLVFKGGTLNGFGMKTFASPLLLRLGIMLVLVGCGGHHYYQGPIARLEIVGRWVEVGCGANLGSIELEEDGTFAARQVPLKLGVNAQETLVDSGTWVLTERKPGDDRRSRWRVELSFSKRNVVATWEVVESSRGYSLLSRTSVDSLTGIEFCRSGD